MLIGVAVSITSMLAHPVTVPFVGCKSHGQVETVEAPRGEPKVVSVSVEEAKHLAYYETKYGPGILAPRGWFCLGANGSSSVQLWVSPSVIDPEQVFTSKWAGFAGPVVALSQIDGVGISGGYDVALIIARVFPAHRSYLKGFLADGLKFQVGPYPGDKLTYKSKDIVEYLTPAQSEGLGAQYEVRKNGSPIRGVAILTPEPMGLDLLSVRLPPELAALAPAIIHQVESDVAKHDWELR